MEAISHRAFRFYTSRSRAFNRSAIGILTTVSRAQKGEVLARSSFSEILYLDSDSVPLTDPTFLFDSPTYKQHGAVLWPDFNRDAGVFIAAIISLISLSPCVV